MLNNHELFYNTVTCALERIGKAELPAIQKAAQKMANAHQDKQPIYTFGTGHSFMITEESYARAGGYPHIIPVREPELSVMQHPFKSTLVERDLGYGAVLKELYPLQAGSVLVVTSNSGRNPLVVEFALYARKQGATVVALTSKQHSARVLSRHPSGKKLLDVAHIVIDNQCPPGDVSIKVGPNKIAPISTITTSFIWHQLMIAFQELLLKLNLPCSVYKSSNLDGNDALNFAQMRDVKGKL